MCPGRKMDFVFKYLQYLPNLSGIALNEPLYVSGLQPMFLFDRIYEPAASERQICVLYESLPKEVYPPPELGIGTRAVDSVTCPASKNGLHTHVSYSELVMLPW